MGQGRSTQRYEGIRQEKDKGLIRSMLALARKNPEYGYRKVASRLKEEGWAVNLKRVHRLWKKEGLQVRTRKKRYRPIGVSDNACFKRKAEHPGDVWTYDFVFDTTMDGATLKIMPIVDEFTRECLSILVARTINAEDVLKEMERLFRKHGQPNGVRSDNGGEYLARSLRKAYEKKGVKTLHIAPGAPWENGYCESFIGKFKAECLNRELFGSLKEAQVLIEQHRKEYNELRPHQSLGQMSPAKFARKYWDLQNSINKK